jgi:hypothetical protein
VHLVERGKSLCFYLRETSQFVLLVERDWSVCALIWDRPVTVHIFERDQSVCAPSCQCALSCEDQ